MMKLTQMKTELDLPPPKSFNALGGGAQIHSSDCVTAVAKSISERIPSETEFYSFEDDKNQDKFQAGQVWAVYCELDGFPKYYARIKKVESIPQFKLTIQWLEECTPRNSYLLQWLNPEMPISCGIFCRSNYTEFHDTSAFCHLLDVTLAARNKFEIYPRKGQVWAMYRNISSEWSSSDLQTCEYDIGQVLKVNDNYKVLVLEKVSGYKTVFKAQAKAGRRSILEIPQRQLLKFSHQIPAVLLTDEKEGRLRGCWELDPYAIPDCLFSSVTSTLTKKASFAVQAGAKEMGSDGVGTHSNIVAQRNIQGPFHMDSCEITKAQCSKFGKPNNRINSGEKNTMVGKRKSPEGNSSTGLADAYKERRTEEISRQPPCKRKANTVSVGKRSCDGPTFGNENAVAHAKNRSPDDVNTIHVSEDEDIPSSSYPLKFFEKQETVFCNFDNERSCDKFKTGQIWALYCKLDELPKNYAQIESVESYPRLKLVVNCLISCNPPKGVIPWLDKGMPVCCGTFKVASGKGVVFNDSIFFSHQLSGVEAGNHLCTIYPRVGEVWALHSKFSSDLTCSSLKNCDYCIVEVLEVVDSRWIIISVLQNVTGFKTVFNAKKVEGLDSIAGAVPWIELYRFSHQVPAFRLTEARYGKLCGCWELDPRSMPVCLYSTY